MIKVTNGTKGFLNQISRKVNIEKEFKNYLTEDFCNTNLKMFLNSLKKEFDTGKVSTYMCNIYRDNVNNNELYLLREYFKNEFPINSIFEISSRCYIQNKLFHSLNYRNKGAIDSYSVCFSHNKTEHFGKITKFISINGNIYAIIAKFHIQKEFELPSLPESYGFKKNKNFQILKEIFFKFYFCFNESIYTLKLVPVSDILCNCLIVYSEYDSYFTKLAYYFEHD